MQDKKTKILSMLASGKISVEEADRLLKALDNHGGEVVRKRTPRFFNIFVDSEKPGEEKVRIRIPFLLIKAGAKMANFIPGKAKDKIQSALSEKGIDFDINEINSSNIDAMLEAFTDLEVRVEDGESVRIYCE